MLKNLTWVFFILIFNINAEESKIKNTEVEKSSYIDNEGDKIIVLDLEARRLLQSTKEIKAIDLYDTEENKKNNLKIESKK